MPVFLIILETGGFEQNVPCSTLFHVNIRKRSQIETSLAYSQNNRVGHGVSVLLEGTVAAVVVMGETGI